VIRLTVLGSCGTFPAPGRACSGYLLEAGPDDGSGVTARVWVDVGGGSLANLLAVARPAELDAIWISHLHVDHVSDLPLVFYALRFGNFGRPPPTLPVYGPSGWADRLRGYVSLGTRAELEEVFEARELSDGARLTFGPLELTAVKTKHSVEAYAVRASAGGRTIAYSADTGPCDAVHRLARGADLFLCESAWAEAPDGLAEDHEEFQHMTPTLAGRFAAEAGAAQLVLTHLRPHDDPRVALDRARDAYGGKVGVALERDVYQLGGTP
jgi:ribonuclease BN (tRNA processing enzyme)